MAQQSMDTLKSMNLKPLNIKCDHKGGLMYWCRECAYEAAGLLRQENERLTAQLESLKKDKKPRGRK